MMTCRELDLLIEPLASGEGLADASMADHLATCRRCAGGLELARRIDRMLPSLIPIVVPAAFTGALLARVRRDRWRAEQFLDWGFNLAIAGGVGLVVLGVYLLINLSGLAAVASDASELLAAGLAVVMDRVAAALPTYLAAAGLLGTALAAWWWAERQLTP